MGETPRIYHNPRCSKSRAALALLREQGIEPEIVDYLKTPPDRATLEALIAMLRIRPRDLLRTGEAEYGELGLANLELPDERIVQAMADHPKLIERPIVVQGGQARIGRPPERILEIL
jgi:arsenate reductase (glutaredoxin)